MDIPVEPSKLSVFSARHDAKDLHNLYFVRYWKEPTSFTQQTHHTFQVFCGAQKKIRCEIDGIPITIFVAAEDIKKYGIDVRDFTRSLQKVRRWMDQFSKETLQELSSSNRLGTTLHALPAYEKHTLQLDALQNEEFCALAPSYSKWHWTHLRLSDDTSLRSKPLILQKQGDFYAVHKISRRILVQGGYANIHAVGLSWVVRILQHPNEKRHKQMLHILQKLHSEDQNNQVIGIEPMHKEISYIDPEISHVLDKQSVTVSPRAYSDAYAYLQKDSPKQEIDIIAHAILQGLETCVNKHIGYLDIKPENILLYGDTNSEGDMILSGAALIDFEGAIDFEEAKLTGKKTSDCILTYSPEYIYNDDAVFMRRRRGAKECSYAELETLTQQMSIFAMGVVLYELYTRTPFPSVLAAFPGGIVTIDHLVIAEKLRESSLSQEEEDMILRMIQPDRTQRPDITQVRRTFS